MSKEHFDIKIAEIRAAREEETRAREEEIRAREEKLTRFNKFIETIRKETSTLDTCDSSEEIQEILEAFFEGEEFVLMEHGSGNFFATASFPIADGFYKVGFSLDLDSLAVSYLIV